MKTDTITSVKTKLEKTNAKIEKLKVDLSNLKKEAKKLQDNLEELQKAEMLTKLAWADTHEDVEQPVKRRGRKKKEEIVEGQE